MAAGESKLKQSMYVCTFCQVFSPAESSMINHIAANHGEFLPEGTTARSFVSKLQALAEDKKKCPNKIGRPKKSLISSVNASKSKPQDEVLDPVPRSDGLFWCQKCYRHFKKARQLVKHLCLEDDEEGDFSDEMAIDSDETPDFRSHITLDPVPWSRRIKHQIINEKSELQNPSLEEKDECKTLTKPEKEIFPKIPLNWRMDESYKAIFENEEERLKFEEHLRSIDYSFVDDMFEKTLNNKRRKKSSVTSSAHYSCICCRKSFNSLVHIRMHCLTHTELKPFSCPKCPFATNSKGNLYIHMRTHTGNVFHCSYCDFQSIRRTHVLDHEATHSTVPQICNLCKNSYKTVRSLIAHVKRCHDNMGGKKYVKVLLLGQGKNTIIHCSVCQKKFKTMSSFEDHNRTFHIPVVSISSDSIQDNDKNLSVENVSNENNDENQMDEGSGFLQPNENMERETLTPVRKDPLTELVIRNFLNQEDSRPILFNNVYEESELRKMFAATVLLNTLESEQLSSLNIHNQFNQSKHSNIQECDKTLDLAILDECLRSPNFTKQCLDGSFAESSLSNECHEQYELQPILSSESALRNESCESTPESITLSQINQKLVNKKEQENKSAEIKLFEKCHRAPAYVCCVCSAIFICSSTLKAHLKDHVYSSNSSPFEQEEVFEETKMSDAYSELDTVCPVLTDETSACSQDEKELEKLYSSSMDMIWYLPEVSVVLENDPALFDSVLDDITNFTNGKYDEQEDINVEDSEESVLECFDTI